MPIQGEKIYLRAMELSDMDVYQEMLNDESISQNVGGWSFPVSKFEQEHWFQKSVLDPRNKRFSIVLKETDEVVGMVTLTDIDWQNRSAFHGIKLRSSCPKRQGIATDAVMTLMKYAFEEVNLHRLDGSILAYNKASENLYMKCGWSVEGTKKDAVFRNGKYHDLNITGITKARYLEIKQKFSALQETTKTHER